MKFYSKNGKEIPVRHGVVVHPGSFIRKGDEFITVEKQSIILIGKKEWNDQCQAWENGGVELKEIN